MTKEKGNCSLCGQFYTGFGHNTEPIKTGSRCCNLCMYMLVMPARLDIQFDTADAVTLAHLFKKYDTVKLVQYWGMFMNLHQAIGERQLQDNNKGGKDAAS